MLPYRPVIESYLHKWTQPASTVQITATLTEDTMYTTHNILYYMVHVHIDLWILYTMTSFEHNKLTNTDAVNDNGSGVTYRKWLPSSMCARVCSTCFKEHNRGENFSISFWHVCPKIIYDPHKDQIADRISIRLILKYMIIWGSRCSLNKFIWIAKFVETMSHSIFISDTWGYQGTKPTIQIHGIELYWSFYLYYLIMAHWM